jgi:DNA polymerase type B, organellar and viral
MKRNQEDQAHDGSVRKWHAWKDTSGMPYAPMMWQNGTITTAYGSALAYGNSLSELLDNVASRKLFVLCRDLLSEQDFSFSNALIGSPFSHPYLSRSGGISALRVSQKKQSGFLVPASTWGITGEITEESLKNIITVFQLFDLQSSTPASLSEKVLRTTLPDKINYSRPSLILRDDILKNTIGGRIDTAKGGQFYAEIYEYDKIWAYPSHACEVPDPGLAPVLCCMPSPERALDFPTGYWLVHLRCVSTVIAPIQINGRNPLEGEEIVRWLWTEELRACVECGYEIKKIQRGYGFRAMSNFMEQWAYLLREKWEQAKRKEVQRIIKSMAVGLLGRFLRQPVSHLLIPLSEARPRTPGRDDGDIPLRMHLGPGYKDGDRIISDYAMRPEYDRESTALCQVGAYVVMKMRMELYEMMRKEQKNGRKVIQSYIDCYALDGPTTLHEIIGDGMGQWKEKRYGPSWTSLNGFVGINRETGEIDARLPGYKEGSTQRLTLMSQFNEYWKHA